jgi:selenocysteine lyase/cysteine desulfurase
LTFRSGDAHHLHRELSNRDIIVDHRGDRLRIGFGVYQDEDDVARLVAALAEIG